jgi:hypothetical protein
VTTTVARFDASSNEAICLASKLMRNQMRQRKFNVGDKVIGNEKKASFRGREGAIVGCESVVGWARPTNYSTALNHSRCIHYLSFN